MKVEKLINDLKSLLNLEKVMPKTKERMEKVVALMLLAYGRWAVEGVGIVRLCMVLARMKKVSWDVEGREVEGLFRSICFAKAEDPTWKRSDLSADSESVEVLQEADPWCFPNLGPGSKT